MVCCCMTRSKVKVKVTRSEGCENGRFQSLCPIFTRKPSCRWQTRAIVAPYSGGTPSNINEIYTSMKSTFSGLQFCRWQYGSISIRLAVVAFQMYEIARNSKKIRTYSSLRSSKAIDLAVSRKPTYDFLLIINRVTLDVSATVFEILTHLARK